MLPIRQLAVDAVLLAEANRLDGLTSGFRGQDARVSFSTVLVVLLVVAAFVVGLWLLSKLADRQQRRQSDSPLGLFLSLCRAHRLRWPDAWLLWRVARHHRLAAPGRVFLEPERLDPAALGSRFRAQAGRLRGLEQRLFAGLEEPKTAGPVEQETPPVAPVDVGPPADVPAVQTPAF